MEWSPSSSCYRAFPLGFFGFSVLSSFLLLFLGMTKWHEGGLIVKIFEDQSREGNVDQSRDDGRAEAEPREGNVNRNLAVCEVVVTTLCQSIRFIQFLQAEKKSSKSCKKETNNGAPGRTCKGTTRLLKVSMMLEYTNIETPTTTNGFRPILYTGERITLSRFGRVRTERLKGLFQGDKRTLEARQWFGGTTETRR